jgi:hypothetical protein
MTIFLKFSFNVLNEIGRQCSGRKLWSVVWLTWESFIIIIVQMKQTSDEVERFLKKIKNCNHNYPAGSPTTINDE